MGVHKNGENLKHDQPAESARPQPTTNSDEKNTAEDNRELDASDVKIGMIVDGSVFTGDLLISMSEEYIVKNKSDVCSSTSTEEQDKFKKTDEVLKAKGPTAKRVCFKVEDRIHTFLNIDQTSSRIDVASGNVTTGSLTSINPSCSARIGMVIRGGTTFGGNGTIKIDMSERYISYK